MAQPVDGLYLNKYVDPQLFLPELWLRTVYAETN